MGFTSADRAVSTGVNYVLLLGIVTLLVAVLLAGTANVVQDEREEAVRAGLNVVGNRLAADLESTSTLVTTVGTDGAVTRQVDLPDDVAGVAYRIELSSAGGDVYRLTLTTDDPGVVETVTFVSATPITQPAVVDGGPVTISWETGVNGDRIEVHDG